VEEKQPASPYGGPSPIDEIVASTIPQTRNLQQQQQQQRRGGPLPSKQQKQQQQSPKLQAEHRAQVRTFLRGK